MCGGLAMLNPYQLIHTYFKIVLPYQFHDNKYKIRCQPPILSFRAFFWKYFLDDDEAMLQATR